MNILKLKQREKQFRARRTRSKLMVVSDRPRLCVFRSNAHIYAQLIDDVKRQTVASANDLELKGAEKKTKTEKAKLVGAALAKKAQDLKILEVVFDKGAYKYHGIIKSLADGAREGGLKF